MFVRNNRYCPACGRTQIFDLTTEGNIADGSKWTMQFVATCYECYAQWDVYFNLHVVISACLSATKSLRYRDPRKRCWRWRTSYDTNNVRTRGAIAAVASEIFSENRVDWEVAKLPVSLSLLRGVLSTLGDAALAIDWIPVPYEFGDWTRFTVRSGQFSAN